MNGKGEANKASPARSVPLPPPPPPLPPCQQPSTSTVKIPVQCRSRPVLQQSSTTIEVAAGRGRAVVSMSFSGKHRPALQELRGMGLTRAMRALDTLRRHNSTQEEAEVLATSGRLDVQERAQLLILCGCKRGGRLTSDEMQTVHRVTQSMAEAYVRLELLFRSLTAHQVGAEAEKERKLEAFFEAADTWLGLYETARKLAKEKQAELASISHAEHRSDQSVDSLQGAEGPRSSRPFPSWLCTLMERYRTDRHLEACTGRGNTPLLPPPHDETPVLASTGAAGEGAQGGNCSASSMPSSPLEYRRTAALTTVVADPCNSVDSLARFCRFLAGLVVSSLDDRQPPSMTDRERKALAELLWASDDGSDRRSEISRSSSSNSPCSPDTRDNLRGEENNHIGTLLLSTATTTTPPSCHLVDFPPRPLPAPPTGTLAAAVRPLRYWALRLHRFLLSVRELKAVPERGTEALENKLSEMSPITRRRRGGGGGGGVSRLEGTSSLFPTNK